MSAFIVPKGQIDALVQSLIVEGVITPRRRNEVGQLLWHENHLSLQARYGDEPNTPEYTAEIIEAPLDDLKVWRLLDCYDYQTCEHEGWREGWEHIGVEWFQIGERREARRLHDELEAVYQARYGCQTSYDVVPHNPQYDDNKGNPVPS